MILKQNIKGKNLFCVNKRIDLVIDKILKTQRPTHYFVSWSLFLFVLVVVI